MANSLTTQETGELIPVCRKVMVSHTKTPLVKKVRPSKVESHLKVNV